MADDPAVNETELLRPEDTEKSEPNNAGTSKPKQKTCAFLGTTKGKIALLALFLSLAIIVVIVILVIVCYSPTVQVGCFKVKGSKSEGIFVFKGIPYAEPPVGPLRWKPPLPIEEGSPKCEASKYEATQFGTKCYQRNFVNTSKYEGSEDCLFLNVWTPSLDPNSKLPVMVWIHGGYLYSFDGNTPTYSPNKQVTKDTNVVFVSMNYRLNAFGFMALDVLSEDSKTNTSGNYGFMDQILALEWVKQNIVNFGGDPNLVTIFGQSSGGTSIYALLAAPKAMGLFHRAWLLSPSAIFNKTLEEASSINLVFLKKTGCENITCLRALSPRKLVDSIPWDEYPYWAMTDLFDLPTKGHFDGPLAIVDGVVIPEIPRELWKKKAVNVPIMIGSTAQEVDLWPPMGDVTNWNKTEYENYVYEKLDTFSRDISQEALNQYPYIEGSNGEYLITSMTSDLRINCPLDELSEAIAETSNYLVYRYVITARPSQPVSYLDIPFKPSFAYHCIDSFAFFGTLKDYIDPLSESEIRFQNILREEILSFVRTGKVSSTIWSDYPSSTAVIDSNLITMQGYNKEKCDFWETNGFNSYAWIN